MKRITMLTALAAMVTVGAATAAELPKALVDPYLQVQVALTTDKTDGVAANAKAIETAATALGKEGGAIVAGAKKLAVAKDIVAARAAFGEVSDALVTYAEKTKSDLAGLHIAYCPMANKPWLQKETEIKNPYYGSAMLTCGTIKK